MLGSEVVAMGGTDKQAPGAGDLSGSRARYVVVGVDGSPASSKALAFAAEEAAMRQATLKVVEAWSIPALAEWVYLPPDTYDDIPGEVASSLDAQVAEVLGASPSIEIEKVVEEGPSAQVLIEAAKGAELLVVGSRGRGGFAGLLLGSVSSHLAHHAPCPVAIVHG
jgi:nucleotide-binding universal stress UspA family protein